MTSFHLRPRFALAVCLVLFAASASVLVDASSSSSSSSSSSARPCWSKTYATPQREGFLAYKIRPDNHAFVSGGATPANATDSDVLVALLDAAGAPVWAASFGGPHNEFAPGVWPTPDGGAILGATTSGKWGEAWAPTFWLLKVSGNGTLEWERAYWFPNVHGEILSVQATFHGGVHSGYVVGGRAPGVQFEGILVRLGLDGNVTWARHVSQGDTPALEDYDELWRVAQAPRGGGYVATGWSSTNHGMTGNTDRSGWVLKLDENGDTEWFHLLGSPTRNEELYWVKEMERLNPVTGLKEPVYVASGYAVVGADNTRDVYVVMLDRQGGLVWQRTFRVAYGTDESAVHVHHVDADVPGQHALVLAGNARAIEHPRSNAYVAAIAESDGALLWAKEYLGADDDVAPSRDTFTLIEPALNEHNHADPRLAAAGYTYNTGGLEGDGWVVTFPYGGAPTMAAGSPLVVRDLPLHATPNPQLPPPPHPAVLEGITSMPLALGFQKDVRNLTGFRSGPVGLAVSTQGTC